MKYLDSIVIIKQVQICINYHELYAFDQSDEIKDLIMNDNNCLDQNIFSISPNLKYLTLITTRFNDGGYQDYPINIIC